MYQLTLIFVLLVSCTAQNSSDNTPQNEPNPTEVLDMWIHHFQSPCVGEGDPVLCLQVQFGEAVEEENWEYFYDAIEGFDGYELGNIYHLKVTQSGVEEPMADASSLTYHMQELVSTKPVDAETTFTLFLKQEGAPAYITPNEETGNYVLANELVVVADSQETAKVLDAKLTTDEPFNGVFRHTEDRDAIVLVGIE